MVRDPVAWLKRVLLNDGPEREPRPDEIVVLAEASDAAEAGLWSEIVNRNGVHGVPVDAGYVTWAGADSPRGACWSPIAISGERAS